MSSKSDEAVSFIKNNKDLLIEKFANLELFPSTKDPFTVFMAGSPGAGKTEFSKRLVGLLNSKVVRIDADEVRDMIPQYTGLNSDVVQGAAALGVEKLYDYVLKKNQDVIIDGTFAVYNKSLNNIERSLKRKRLVNIFYIYQDPQIAWDFTKKREKLEGRYVPKEVFITSFFAAKDNVNKINSIFKDKIIVDLIIKDFENGIKKTKFNIDNIDNYLEMNYTKESLGVKLL